MTAFFTVIHVLLCVFMIFVILLQPGKDAGMGAALGGGAASTAFGGRGAVTFLTKLTAVCATIFFMTSLGLSFVGLRGSVAERGTLVTKPKPVASPPVPVTTTLNPAPAGTPPPTTAPPAAKGIAPAAGAAATPAGNTEKPAKP